MVSPSDASLRALASKRPSVFLWFWIGDHKSYDLLIRRPHLPGFSSLLLHLAVRPQAAHLKGTVDGVLRGNAQIVAGGPDPEAARLAGKPIDSRLRLDPQQNLVLASRSKVRGRVGFFQNEIEMIAAKSVFESRQRNRMLELKAERESVPVEDRRLHHLHAQLRQAASGERGQVAADKAFGPGKID